MVHCVTVLSEEKGRCGKPEMTDCVTVLSEGKDMCSKPEVSGTLCNGALRGKGQVW